MPRKNDGYRRYFEAAAVLGQITRARAEELVREFMSSGDVQRAQAQQWVDELMDRSRKAAEDLLGLVRTEVSNQMQALGLDPEDLARQAAEILRRSAEAGLRVVHDVTPPRGAKKTSAKEAAKKATAKKAAGGKKAAAKKAAGGKKAAAKKAAGAKKSATKKSTAKASGSKKTAAEKSATTKRAAKKSAAGTHTPAPASTR